MGKILLTPIEAAAALGIGLSLQYVRTAAERPAALGPHRTLPTRPGRRRPQPCDLAQADAGDALMLDRRHVRPASRRSVTSAQAMQTARQVARGRSSDDTRPEVVWRVDDLP